MRSAARATAAGRRSGVKGPRVRPTSDRNRAALGGKAVRNREDRLRNMADSGATAIVGVGFAYSDSVNAVAPDYPKVNFAIVDGFDPDAKPNDNVAYLTFAANEGSYLVGVAAVGGVGDLRPDPGCGARRRGGVGPVGHAGGRRGERDREEDDDAEGLRGPGGCRHGRQSSRRACPCPSAAGTDA